MRTLFLTLVLCSRPAAAPAETPCAGNTGADFCGPGEVRLPFLQPLPGRVSFPPGAPAPVPPGNTGEPAAGNRIEKKAPLRGYGVRRLSIPETGRKKIKLFYTYDCPHCRQAMAWLPGQEKEYPGLYVEQYEVKRSSSNRALLASVLAEHGAGPAGFPAFVIGGRVLTGFSPVRIPEIRAALDELYGRTGRVRPGSGLMKVPLLGGIDPASVPLSRFSFALGLLDGLNPCAIWVLVFLMGLLVHTRSQKRMLLIGGIFIAASASVYFAFMAAWFNLFMVIGHAGWITAGLGIAAAVMGLINLKEIFFFRHGVSLMIPDRAKITLADKIRGLIRENETTAAVGGTIALAVFVNLIELGCTVGLPAVFTRVLSERQAGLAEKYLHIGIYNAAYVIPLAVIVALFVFTMGRYRMTERHGKILKGVSGILMLALGLIMTLKPELLVLGGL